MEIHSIHLLAPGGSISHELFINISEILVNSFK